MLTVIYLMGCSALRVEMIKTPEEKTESSLMNAILRTFPNDRAIILSYEKYYQNTFNIAKNFNQYKLTDNTPTHDEFYIWITKNLWYKKRLDRGDEFGSVYRFIKSRHKHTAYIEIKKNWELFIKIGNDRL